MTDRTIEITDRTATIAGPRLTPADVDTLRRAREATR